MTRWLSAVTSIVGAAASGALSLAYAQAPATYHIAPQPLQDALVAFSEQADISLSLPNEGLGAARSPGLDGSYDTAQALERLLAGTGYRFERAGDRAFRILATPSHASATQPPTEEVIVVTARRPTPLRNLPRSLTDIGADTLEQLTIPDSHSIATQASGLQFTDLGAGRDKLYIRGVSDGALTGRAQSTVGIYLDGVRLTYAAPDPQLQLVDVSRVDVLRGPQGALYGAGSIGGILSIESNPPDSVHASGSILGSAETTRGGGVSSDAELVLNIPIAPDRLAVRLAAYDQRTAGWLDNVVTGRRDTNETQRTGYRLSAQLDLSPQWRVRAFEVDQAIDSRDSQYLSQTAGGTVRAAPFAEPHDNDFQMSGASLHGSTSFGDIDSTTALVRHDINSRFDATGGFAALGVNPALARPMDEHTALDLIVHETRLTGPADAAIPWFIGFFYADGDYQSGRVLRDGAPNVWSDAAYDERRTDSIDEFALFGETTWRLSRSLTLSTGLRAFQYRVKTQSTVAEPLLALSASSSNALSDRGVAPDIRLAYQPTDTLLVYLSAAEGYRSGGFNTGEPVGSSLGPMQPLRRFAGDELWTYELGGRTSLLDRRLRLSAAIFHNEWSRLQTDDLIANHLPFTGNVGSARSTGFESDAAFDLSDALTLSAHLLINEPDISKPDPTFPVSTSSLPGAPELLASGAIAYEREVRPGLIARARLDLAFVGNSSSTFASGSSRDSYSETDVSFDLSHGQTGVRLYVTNLFDEGGETFSVGNPYMSSGPLITRLRPFTVGLQLRHSF